MAFYAVVFDVLMDAKKHRYSHCSDNEEINASDISLGQLMLNNIKISIIQLDES